MHSRNSPYDNIIIRPAILIIAHQPDMSGDEALTSFLDRVDEISLLSFLFIRLHASQCCLLAYACYVLL